jgi:tetratricopeptide (TPR) repeat protein
VGNPAVANAMAQGAQAMSSKHYRSAYQYFSEVIDRAPDFAEGWNKRATVLFLAKAYDRSIRDIKEVLRLEPRHFGALSGLGLIFLRQGQFRPATQAFRDALAINPYLPRIREALDQLEHRQRSIDEKNAI